MIDLVIFKQWHLKVSIAAQNVKKLSMQRKIVICELIRITSTNERSIVTDFAKKSVT